jgi:hypothetical protein
VTGKPQPEEEPPPDLEGPDPRTWPGRSDIWDLVEDVRRADEVYEVLDGKIARDGMSDNYFEARNFLKTIADERRERLSIALLTAFAIPLAADREAAD